MHIPLKYIDLLLKKTFKWLNPLITAINFVGKFIKHYCMHIPLKYIDLLLKKKTFKWLNPLITAINFVGKLNGVMLNH